MLSYNSYYDLILTSSRYIRQRVSEAGRAVRDQHRRRHGGARVGGAAQRVPVRAGPRGRARLRPAAEEGLLPALRQIRPLPAPAH